MTNKDYIPDRSTNTGNKTTLQPPKHDHSNSATPGRGGGRNIPPHEPPKREPKPTNK